MDALQIPITDESQNLQQEEGMYNLKKKQGTWMSDLAGKNQDNLIFDPLQDIRARLSPGHKGLGLPKFKESDSTRSPSIL